MGKELKHKTNHIFFAIVLTFLLSILGYLLKDPLILMICPATSVLLMLILKLIKLKTLGIRKSKIIFILAAYFLPLVLYTLMYVIIWNSNLSNLNLYGIIPKETPGISNMSEQSLIILFLIIQLVIGFGTNIIFSFGEEIFWRGYLVPTFFKRNHSIAKTGIITGAIWALWHLPLILINKYVPTGIPEWIGLLFFSVDLITGGIIFAYLRIKSNSIWPAVILHASINTFVQGILVPITQVSQLGDYVVGEFGFGGIIINLLVLSIIFTRKFRHENI